MKTKKWFEKQQKKYENDIEYWKDYCKILQDELSIANADGENRQVDALVIPKIAEPREDDFINTVTQTILAWHYEDGDINNLINTLIEKDIKNLFSDWQGYTEELSNFSE